jgi:hypothetical protein
MLVLTIFACLRLTGNSKVLMATAAAGMTAHHGSPVALWTASNAAAPAAKYPRSGLLVAAAASTSADELAARASGKSAGKLLGPGGTPSVVMLLLAD